MADYEDSIFDNLPQRKRRAGDGNTYSRFREAMGLYVPEGPLPPRPPERRSGKGGPSLGVSNSPPVASSSPTVTGNAAVGQTLSCDNGVWFYAPTSYTYQWKRDGVVIAGATSSTYVVVSADLGHALTCTVTATNSHGSTPATSNAVVIVAVPVNTTAPVASGSLTVGSTLSCTTGAWSNSPTSYAYQWQRGGTNISGATASTYVTVTADAGTSVGCVVTASNAAGSASQASNTLAIAGGVVASVWSASDAAANGLTLSNGGTTVTISNAAAWKSIRNSISQASGKFYIEFYSVSTNAGSGYLGFGLASASFVATNFLGSTNYSAGILPGAAGSQSSGFTTNYNTNLPVPAQNDVWALAVDFSTGGVWLAKNNTWSNSSNPVTGSSPILSFVPATVGALFGAMEVQNMATLVWTVQGSPASQKYLPPPGFQAWDGGPVTPTTSVWSASDAAANAMTLSNGGLTVTAASTGAWQSVRGTQSKSSGKLYVEFKAAAISTEIIILGLASAGFSATTYIGNSTYSGGNFPNFGSNFVSVGFTANFATSASTPNTNDVWALAVDFATGNIWLAQNNAWVNSSNPATGTLPILSFVQATVGALFPAMSLQNASDGSWTLQATAASQTYAPPSGFTPWDGAGAHSAQATAYLARTVGGNEGGNATNIATLIDGLVADGVWSKLDCLYVLAQQNATDALLNLIGTSYPLSKGTDGSTFTTYRGFQGFTTGLNSGFNPTTAPSPHFVQNSASIGVWTGGQDNTLSAMAAFDGTTTHLVVGYAGNFYARINNGSIAGVAASAPSGFYVGDRETSANVNPFINGADQGAQAGVAISPVNLPFLVGASPDTFGSTAQTLSAAFIGGSLGAAGQLALYNRLRTYLTAVGVP